MEEEETLQYYRRRTRERERESESERERVCYSALHNTCRYFHQTHYQSSATPNLRNTLPEKTSLCFAIASQLSRKLTIEADFKSFQVSRVESQHSA